jgi:hypothetical protein
VGCPYFFKNIQLRDVRHARVKQRSDGVYDPNDCGNRAGRFMELLYVVFPKRFFKGISIDLSSVIDVLGLVVSKRTCAGQAAITVG